MALQKIIVFSLLIGAVSTETLDRCTFIKELEKVPGLIGSKDYTAGDYVCLAHYISGYETSLHNSPTAYGILQINSEWCDDSSNNWCGIQCKALLDRNINDDLWCLLRVVQGPGLEAWSVWREKCKGQDLSQYTDGCNR
ncbi:sperm acrosome-associated protein 5-like isoform X3 [Rana temporaria]|uniref:sperm acrosome-associated protein 5-like isoform X3 n=1 Tax=Rana temporaria TaxID=8407 RepID=UPI001AAC98F8|nr:sperm acrosome-associated protein 5-like isoform X3 [Rana temporaria]